jgi:hypothetical protein
MPEERIIEEPRGEPQPDHEHMDDQSAAGLVTGVIADARHLIGAELESLKLEVKEELARAKNALAVVALGGGVLAVGGLMLVLMLVYGLFAGTGLPLWGSFGIVGGVLAIAGTAMLLIGRKRATSKDADLWPEETLQDMKKDMQWAKDQVRPQSH